MNHEQQTINSELSTLEDFAIDIESDHSFSTNFPLPSLHESALACLQAQISSIGSLPIPLREKLALLAELKKAIGQVKVSQGYQRVEEERRRQEKDEEEQRLKRKFQVGKIFKRKTALRSVWTCVRKWAVPWKATVRKIECRFGSAVSAYFYFLHWLTGLNLITTLIVTVGIVVPEFFLREDHEIGKEKNFGPLTISELYGKALHYFASVSEHLSNNNSRNVGVANALPMFYIVWQLEGPLKHSLLFYGNYSSSKALKIQQIGLYLPLPVLYLLTIIFLYLFNVYSIIKRINRSRKLSTQEGKVLKHGFPFSRAIFCAWEHTITSVSGAHFKRKEITMRLREKTTEISWELEMRIHWRLIIRRLGTYFIFICLILVASFAVFNSVHLVDAYDVRKMEVQNSEDDQSWFLVKDTTVVMTVISNLFPALFEWLAVLEAHHPRTAVRVQMGRVAILSIVNMGSLLLSLVSTVGVKSRELVIMKDSIFSEMIRVNNSSFDLEKLQSFPTVRIKRDGRDHDYGETIYDQFPPSVIADPYTKWTIKSTTSPFSSSFITTTTSLPATSTKTPSPILTFSINLVSAYQCLRNFFSIFDDLFSPTFNNFATNFTTNSTFNFTTTNTIFNSNSNFTLNSTLNTFSSDLYFQIFSSSLNSSTFSRLDHLCWETALGQEFMRVILLDLLMMALVAALVDVARCLFVRYITFTSFNFRSWPNYSDFKVADNLLYLVNHQAIVWMGVFFSPALPALSTLKLIIVYYFRTLVLRLCNIPQEQQFFTGLHTDTTILWILLGTLVFSGAILFGSLRMVAPSWHCGPFSGYNESAGGVFRILLDFWRSWVKHLASLYTGVTFGVTFVLCIFLFRKVIVRKSALKLLAGIWKFLTTFRCRENEGGDLA